MAAGDVRQSLVEALRPALSRAGSGDDIGARALVAKYLQQPGALEYQAEFVIGYCYQHQKNYTSAKQHFERALAIAPAYYPPWHFIGYADYYLGDLDGARHAFEQHLKSVPDEGESWFGLGITNYDQGRLDDAETDFRKAIERNEAKRAADPSGQSGVREVSKACVRLADVLLARQDLTGAREQLERAAQLFPAQAETWFKLSQVRLRLGDAAGAEQATQKFQQLKTGSP